MFSRFIDARAIKGDTLCRGTQKRKKRKTRWREPRKKPVTGVVLVVFKRMEGKVNTCRSFDPERRKREREKEKKEKREKEKGIRVHGRL